MTKMEIEKRIKLSERKLSGILSELRASNIRVHNSSDFSKDGYSIMVSIFIPFPEGYLTNKKIDEIRLVLEGDYR